MNSELMKQMIADGDFEALESAWLEALVSGVPTAEMAPVLEALVACGQGQLAQTCAEMLLGERLEELDAPGALEAARLLCLAVPSSEDLRKHTCRLYRQAHAAHEHIDALLEASGLSGTQSPRRAIRMLDTCLALRAGDYVVNRFDHRTLKVCGFNAVLREFELADGSGRAVHMPPLGLADEFDIVEADDFRVLAQHRFGELSRLLEADPAAVLVAICQMSGGRIDANALKDRLVPRYLPADRWGDWWSKARSAAKRSSVLSLEGRNPVEVVHHPRGTTLEQEMQALVRAAVTPLDKLAALQRYVREARGRKVAVDAAFAGAILESLAQQAASFGDLRPADALAAALAVEAAVALGLAAPAGSYPSAADILAGSDRPAELIASIADHGLWPAAMDAMACRPDAPEQLERLLGLCPASLADEVATRLVSAGRNQALERAVSAALADPVAKVELCCWLWKGPAVEIANMPTGVELLCRLLGAMGELERQWDGDAAVRKSFSQRVRSALGASSLSAFRRAVAQMDDGTADKVKRQIERLDGLAQALREDMLAVLKESFYGLFARAKVQPWLDEGTIWTTQQALDRKQAEMKELTEVKMLENSRAIGAAAAHGDLRENSEWKSAIEERNMLLAKAAKMQEELARAWVIRPEDVPTETVGIGSRVHLRRLEDGGELELSFLGPWESNVQKNIYSYQTQLARELMGKALGQTVSLKIDGRESEYRIERLSLAEV